MNSEEPTPTPRPQSTAKQLTIGGLVGFTLASINRFNGSNVEPLFSLYGIGMLLAGAVTGAIVYTIIYRSWPRS
jgi:hypothetical protein